MKNIIFIAPPAAGKGSYSHMLKENYGYVHISTGDILREAIASGSEIGLQVKNIIDQGNLVNDELMIEIIKDKFTEIKGKPFILDGFPRTLNQAKYLDEIIDANYVVIYLDVSIDILIKRIEGRLTCSCGTPYNLNEEEFMPKVPGICDNCGKELIKRDDDNAEAFKIRYASFQEKTKPLYDYYLEKGKLAVINGDGKADVVFAQILEVLK